MTTKKSTVAKLIKKLTKKTVDSGSADLDSTKLKNKIESIGKSAQGTPIIVPKDGTQGGGVILDSPPKKAILKKAVPKKEPIKKKAKAKPEKRIRDKRPRNWCWTHYDYDDVAWLNHADIRYYKFGDEICPDTGRKHMQGWMQLHVGRDLTYLKKHFHNETHWEECKGSSEKNEEYVGKDGIISTKGKFIKFSGQRTDLDKVIERIQFNEYDKFDSSYIKFGKNIETLLTLKKKQDSYEKAKKEHLELTKDGLLPNQKLWIKLVLEQDNRQILWIADCDFISSIKSKCIKGGGAGKSACADELSFNHGACHIENAAKKDIAYYYNEEPIVCFDFSRTEEDKINYTAIEALKNGRIFSAKYESGIKRFSKPKIIVFANMLPKMEMFGDEKDALSEDKLHILHYEGRKLVKEYKPISASDFNKDIVNNKVDKPLVKKTRQIFNLEDDLNMDDMF